MHESPGLQIYIYRLIFFAVILTLLVGAQVFWYRRGLAFAAKIESPRLKRLAKAVLIVALSFVIVSLVDRLFIRQMMRFGATSWFAGLAQLWVFASFFAFLGIEVVQAVEWLWNKALQLARRRRPAGVDEGRRTFFRYAGYTAAAAPLLVGVYGFADERFQFTVRGVDIPMANLPRSLDGFRIVQLSDIHAGDFMPSSEVQRAVEIANGLGAHVAFITGDLITGRGDPLEPCVAELSRLQAPLGVWGCNGNHEIYADAEDEEEMLFQQHGMKLLRQNSAELYWNGAILNLIGVDYQRGARSLEGYAAPYLSGIERLVRRDVPNILLSHNPNSFPRAAEMGIELSLAGHTHGGQIQVEIIDHSISPARFITKFIAGRYELPLVTEGGTGKQSQLYVNSGLGTIGVPARWGVPPEISLLTLRRA